MFTQELLLLGNGILHMVFDKWEINGSGISLFSGRVFLIKGNKIKCKIFCVGIVLDVNLLNRLFLN